MQRFETWREVAAVLGSVAAAGLASIAMAAVSSGTTAAPVEACRLLTTSQVSAALGVEVGAGARPIADEPRMCNWREAGKPTGPGRNVLLTVISPNEFEDLQKLPLSSPTTGVGDAAFLTHSLRMPVILTVKSGGHYFRLLVRSSVENADGVDERNQDIEKSLAALVSKQL